MTRVIIAIAVIARHRRHRKTNNHRRQGGHRGELKRKTSRRMTQEGGTQIRGESEARSRNDLPYVLSPSVCCGLPGFPMSAMAAMTRDDGDLPSVAFRGGDRVVVLL